MELRQLRYFVAVAEELHFARAAARVGIEQSPLSRQIRELEGRLGVRLLERTTRSTRLTWAGEVFLQDARRVLATVDAMRRSARAAAAGKRGRLRVGVTEHTASSQFARLLSIWHRELPEVEFRVFEVPETQQVARVLAGDLDLGLVTQRPYDTDLEVVELWREPVMVALRRDHALTAKKRIAVTELASERLIAAHRDQESGFEAQMLALLRSTGVEPQIVEYAAHRSTRVSLVEAGCGIAFTLSPTLSTSETGVVLRPFASPKAIATTWAIRRIDIAAEAAREALTVASGIFR